MMVELGPKPTLLGLVAACLPDAQPKLVPSLRAGRPESESMLLALGSVWVSGHTVDWSGVFPRGGRRVSLPTYPWQRERFWRATAARVPAGETTAHPLLGNRLQVAGSIAVYEATLGAGNPAWLDDHRVFGQVLMPGAGIAEMVRAAAAHGRSAGVRIADLVLQAPLLFPDSGTCRVQIVLSEASESTITATVHSRPTDGAMNAAWTKHATATVLRAEPSTRPTALDLVVLRSRCTEALDPAAIRARFAAKGLVYGQEFEGLRSLSRGTGEALAEVNLSASVSSGGYGIFPPLLDAAFQGMVALTPDSDELLLPFAIEDFVHYETGVVASFVHVQLRGEAGSRGVAAELTLADLEGRVVAAVKALRVRPFDERSLRRGRSESLADAIFRLDWTDAPVSRSCVCRPSSSRSGSRRRSAWCAPPSSRRGRDGWSGNGRTGHASRHQHHGRRPRRGLRSTLRAERATIRPCRRIFGRRCRADGRAGSSAPCSAPSASNASPCSLPAPASSIALTLAPDSRPSSTPLVRSAPCCGKRPASCGRG